MRSSSAPFSVVGGRRLPGQGQGVGRKGVGPERRGRASHPKAYPRESSADLDRGMVQGRLADRLAEAAPTSRLRGSTEALGGGAHLLVAFSEQEDEQGLREAVLDQRVVCLRGDGSTHGETVSPCLGLFGRFHRNCTKRGSSSAPTASLTGIRRKKEPNRAYSRPVRLFVRLGRRCVRDFSDSFSRQ